MPQQSHISELDAQAVEINRLQRAMSHLLAANQASSNQLNAHRYAKGKLDARIAEQADQLAAQAKQIASLEAQVAAVWAVAIRTAANVAEFGAGQPNVALAISAHENASIEHITEMLKAANGE